MTQLFFIGKLNGVEIWLWAFQAFGLSVNHIKGRTEEQLEIIFLFFRITFNKKK